MSPLAWVALILALAWIGAVVFTLCLCAAAKRGDEAIEALADEVRTSGEYVGIEE